MPMLWTSSSQPKSEIPMATVCWKYWMPLETHWDFYVGRQDSQSVQESMDDGARQT